MWRVLLLHQTPHRSATRLTTQQHIDALTNVPDAQVLSYNALHGAPSWLRHLRFDAVVLHTTVLGMRWNVWFPYWKGRLDWLSDVDAVKIAFPQDEYDHAHRLDGWLDELGVSVLCTVLDERHRPELYPRLAPRAAFYDVLTGYIDEPTAERIRPRLRPLPDRAHDVVYRARDLPYWFGSHGQLKHGIGQAVVERASRHDLDCDVSTRAQETLLGDSWLEFLAAGRTTVGTESGSSVLDRQGEVRERITELLHEQPGLSFAEVSARMPPGWDDYRFFAVSPRHLEAVVTRTAQILVEGDYSGVLEPERHYIPVRRDFSNLDEALERARDLGFLERLAAQAYADVHESGRFSSRRLTETLERILAEHAAPSAASGPVFRAAKRIAAVESEADRVVLAPVSNVLRVGRAGAREMLAGLRLVAADAETRTLLIDYLRSTETREHVSPRQALADLLCLGVLRRAQRGKFDGGEPFEVSAELDETRRRILLRSRPAESMGSDGSLPVDQLTQLLQTAAVDFSWDHSLIGRSIEFPLAGSRSLRFALPAGPHPLPALNWLARQQPAHVIAALAPILRRP